MLQSEFYGQVSSPSIISEFDFGTIIPILDHRKYFSLLNDGKLTQMEKPYDIFLDSIYSNWNDKNTSGQYVIP